MQPVRGNVEWGSSGRKGREAVLCHALCILPPVTPGAGIPSAALGIACGSTTSPLTFHFCWVASVSELQTCPRAPNLPEESKFAPGLQTCPRAPNLPKDCKPVPQLQICPTAPNLLKGSKSAPGFQISPRTWNLSLLSLFASFIILLCFCKRLPSAFWLFFPGRPAWAMHFQFPSLFFSFSARK